MQAYYQQISNIKLLLTSFDLLTNSKQTGAISDWPTADHVRHFAATSFSLLQQLCLVSHGISYMVDVNVFLVN